MSHQETNIASRREFVQVLGLSALGAGSVYATSEAISPSTAHAAPTKPENIKKDTPETVAIANPKGSVKNVVLMISDGMSMGVPSMAEPFSQLTRGRGTNWHRLMTEAKATHGLEQTDSATGLVTDSAAASSALSTAQKISNGQLSVSPTNGKPLETMSEFLAKAGIPIGLVTTDILCGATPAGFAVQVDSRGKTNEIAEQYLDRADVLLGGGRTDFDGLNRRDGMDLMGRFVEAGYETVLDRDSLLSSFNPNDPKKMLGLFASHQLPYTLDHRGNQAWQRQVPTLAEMTRVALDRLTRRSQANDNSGYFLMVEGARIDHACHHNDAAGMIWDQLAFDDAIGVVERYVDKHPDTLVILTTDHGNGNPGLNGMGGGYGRSNEHFERLARAKASFDLAHGPLKDAAQSSQQALKDRAKDLFGVDLGDDETTILRAALTGSRPLNEVEISASHRDWSFILGQALGNHTGVMFTSHQHTQDLCLRTSFGPTAEALAGVKHHIEVSQHIRDVLASNTVAGQNSAKNGVAQAAS